MRRHVSAGMSFVSFSLSRTNPYLMKLKVVNPRIHRLILSRDYLATNVCRRLPVENRIGSGHLTTDREDSTVSHKQNLYRNCR